MYSELYVLFPHKEIQHHSVCVWVALKKQKSLRSGKVSKEPTKTLNGWNWAKHFEVGSLSHVKSRKFNSLPLKISHPKRKGHLPTIIPGGYLSFFSLTSVGWGFSALHSRQNLRSLAHEKNHRKNQLKRVNSERAPPKNLRGAMGRILLD